MTKLVISLTPLQAAASENKDKTEKTPAQRRLETACYRLAALAHDLGDLAIGDGVVSDLPPELRDRVTALAFDGFCHVFPLVTLLHAASSQQPPPSA